jgi:methanogenic corrinoid protein MtbC1
VLAELNETRPATLVMWASAATDAPAIRQLIDQVREIGGHPNMRIVCGGGVFNRASGLAEEIGAHGSATTPAELVTAVATAAPATAAPAATKRRTRAVA